MSLCNVHTQFLSLSSRQHIEVWTVIAASWASLEFLLPPFALSHPPPHPVKGNAGQPSQVTAEGLVPCDNPDPPRPDTKEATGNF